MLESCSPLLPGSSSRGRWSPFPSEFSTPGAPLASASSFDTACSDNLDPGGSFCPHPPSQYLPLFFSTAY